MSISKMDVMVAQRQAVRWMPRFFFFFFFFFYVFLFVSFPPLLGGKCPLEGNRPLLLNQLNKESFSWKSTGQLRWIDRPTSIAPLAGFKGRIARVGTIMYPLASERLHHSKVLIPYGTTSLVAIGCSIRLRCCFNRDSHCQRQSANRKGAVISEMCSAVPSFCLGFFMRKGALPSALFENSVPSRAVLLACA